MSAHVGVGKPLPNGGCGLPYTMSASTDHNLHYQIDLQCKKQSVVHVDREVKKYMKVSKICSVEVALSCIQLICPPFLSVAALTHHAIYQVGPHRWGGSPALASAPDWRCVWFGPCGAAAAPGQEGQTQHFIMTLQQSRLDGHLTGTQWTITMGLCPQRILAF